MRDINAMNVALRVPIKMTYVIVAIKLVPTGVEVDLEKIKIACVKEIQDYNGRWLSDEVQPIAYGLNALKIIFSYDESRGGTDEIEARLARIENVQSVDVIDVRRAIG